jgi:hypothetical protein
VKTYIRPGPATDPPSWPPYLRNTAIGFHRTSGDTNIARATRPATRRPHDPITAVISSNPRTQ